MERKSKAELSKTANQVMKSHNVNSAIATDDGNVFLADSEGVSAARNHARSIGSELFVFGEPVAQLERVANKADADQVVAGQASATGVENQKDTEAPAVVAARKEILIRIEQLAQEKKKPEEIKKILKKEKFDADMIEEFLNAQVTHS